MESPGLPTPRPAAPDPAQARLKAQARAKSGASWFYWIAALSLLNSIILLTGSTRTFVLGLGITQVVDVFASVFEDQLGLGGGSYLTFLALGLDALVAGLIGLIGYFARKGLQAVYVLGIALYLLDGLLVLAFLDWLSALFHAVALGYMVAGFIALRKLAASPAGTVMTAA
jgi:hypothetical protein